MIKLSSEQMKQSGIYRIYHPSTDRSYIGSTVEFNERFNEHIRTLRQGKHHSVRLQNFWNSYGESTFQFEILEVLGRDPEILRATERAWMTKYRSDERDTGFNIATDTTYTRLATYQKGVAGEYFVVSPTGDQVVVKLLSQFCFDNGLDVRAMRKVARGVLSHVKYWRCWKNGEQPTDIPHTTDFVDFMKQKQLAHSTAAITAHNKRMARNWVFVSPSGEYVHTRCLQELCDTHGLDITTLYEVGNGTRVSHRGWSKASV